MCEIDQKLHAIVAGRKRNTLQTIMEETGTNIYLPSPLQGLVGPDPAAAGGANLGNTRNVFWITGEFFGVQRARDMLYNVSLQKVGHLVVINDGTLTKARQRASCRGIPLSYLGN